MRLGERGILLRRFSDTRILGCGYLCFWLAGAGGDLAVCRRAGSGCLGLSRYGDLLTDDNFIGNIRIQATKGADRDLVPASNSVKGVTPFDSVFAGIGISCSLWFGRSLAGLMG